MENYIVLEHIGEGSFGKVYKVNISFYCLTKLIYCSLYFCNI